MYNIFWFIGLLWCLRWLYRVLEFIYDGWIVKEINHAGRYGKGSWVLITGSTDGIGKSLAFQFAARGFNIVLVSRNEQKLKAVAKEIEKTYQSLKIKTKIIQADFSDTKSIELCKKIEEQTKSLDISVLVNNVGIDEFKLYQDMSIEFIQKMMVINMNSQAFLTKVFLERLEKRQLKSGIININSLSSELPMGRFQLYAGTKAFTHYLTLGLSSETKNIDYLSVKPSEVSTNMTNNKKDIFTVSREQCTDYIMKDFGRRLETYGHPSHAFQANLYACFNFYQFTYVFDLLFLKDFIADRAKYVQSH